MKRAFTLIELVIVMAILVILVGLTLGLTSYITLKGKTSRAEGEIAAMSAALEKYKNDNGVYPTTAPISASGSHYQPSATVYIPNAQVLYASLSGMTNGNYGGAASGPVYVEFTASQLKTNTSPVYVVDPFGNAYGFLTAQGNGSSTNTVLNNAGFFDLWSTAGQDGTGTKTNYSQWIGNWSTR